MNAILNWFFPPKVSPKKHQQHQHHPKYEIKMRAVKRKLPSSPVHTAHKKSSIMKSPHFKIDSGETCKDFIWKFVSQPPVSLHFKIKPLKDCLFDITKVMVRINSTTDPLEWDHLFIYRHGKWTESGGLKATKTMVRETSIPPDKIWKYICQSLIDRHKQARLEIDITFKEQKGAKNCDYVNWDPDTDDMIVSRTRLNSGFNNIIEFDSDSSYPGHVFECSTTELKYIFDFEQNKQISIWDKDELNFQESGKFLKKSGHQRFVRNV